MGNEFSLEYLREMIDSLPWFDFNEYYKKAEERGRFEGRVIGIADVYMETAKKAFEQQGSTTAETIQYIKELVLHGDFSLLTG